MNYLVLARKWRPIAWEDVVGQEHVTVTLKNAIEQKRLAHAYLFTGPRGVGKTSVARILAKTLNCEKNEGESPCNVCSGCKEITESRSIDVMEIDGASNRGIEEVRNLRENIRYTPAKGKYRIYIIDEVHMLTSPAFNALLKTLEEPPDHALFIFATTEPHKVPATIVSRCQRFDFRRITVTDIVEHLKAICGKEEIAIEDEALFLIARKADGSMRDSQSILDQMHSYTEENITAGHVVKALGLIDMELFFEFTDIILEKNTEKAFGKVADIVSGGYDLEEFLSGLTEHFRNLIVAASLSSADLIETTSDYKKRYLELAGGFGEEDLLRLIRIINDTRLSLKRSLNPRIPLELAVVKMIKLDQAVSINELLDMIGSGGAPRNPNSHHTARPQAVVSPRASDPPQAAASPPAAVPPQAAAQSKAAAELQDEVPPALEPNEIQGIGEQNDQAGEPEKRDKATPISREKAVPELTLDLVQCQWNDVIQKLKHKKITIGSFLQEGRVLDVKSNNIEIGFSRQNTFHVESINRNKPLVEGVIRGILGEKTTFHCVQKDFPENGEGAGSKTSQQRMLDDLQGSQPAVKKIIDDFDAEIVE